MVIPVLKGIDVIEIKDEYRGAKLRGTAYIAEESDSGSECFHFQVVNSEYVMQILSENKIINGRALFIIDNFEQEVLEYEINNILKDCVRSTWEETANAINRYLHWEYDNILFMTEDDILSKLKSFKQQ